jgi:hypothetical protein
MRAICLITFGAFLFASAAFAQAGKSSATAAVPIAAMTRTMRNEQRDVPKTPPIQSNPKRDAAGSMDAATKAEVKRKLEQRIAAFRKNGNVLHTAVTRPASVEPREVQALQHQKAFVEALRRQGSIAPLKAASIQLGANSQTMTANSAGAAASPMLLSGAGNTLMRQGPSSSAPQQAGSGSNPIAGGTLQLQGSATGPTQQAPPPSAVQQANNGPNLSTGRTLQLQGPATGGPQQAGNTVAQPPANNGSNLTISGGATLQLQTSVTPSTQQTPPPAAIQPKNGGLNVATGGVLQLGAGSNTNPGTSSATTEHPVLSQLKHPATPNSPINGNLAAVQSNARIASGNVSGYIFWNTSQLHYQLSNPCQGLEVTLSAFSNGSLQKLASSTTFNAPFGSQAVWNLSGQGAQGPWMVCSYVFHQIPEAVPLEADAIVSQSSAFNSPATLFAEHEPLLKNQFVIPGGNCGVTPDSTLSAILNSGSVLCGDSAFNVNFAAQNTRLSVALNNTTVCMEPRIDSVNGVTRVENASNPVVFTQDPNYDDYIITGCGFGSQSGDVYLSGAVTGGRINMVVNSGNWSDTRIEAQVEPGLTGVLDGWPDLIVVPPGGTPAKFPNTRFYAQRQSVLLPGIPQQYVHLDPEQVGDGTHGFGMMYCPGPDLTHLFPCVSFNGGYPLDGVSNGNPSWKNGPSTNVTNAVDRDGGQLKFSPGEDTYDLSYLAPGFVVDGVPGVRWYYWSESVCEMWVAEGSEKPGDSINWDPASASLYNLTQTGTQITVSWGVDHCGWRWLGMFNVDDEYNAGYSLIVYVNGPIGVDPWTGKPTATDSSLRPPIEDKWSRRSGRTLGVTDARAGQ